MFPRHLRSAPLPVTFPTKLVSTQSLELSINHAKLDLVLSHHALIAGVAVGTGLQFAAWATFPQTSSHDSHLYNARFPALHQTTTLPRHCTQRSNWITLSTQLEQNSQTTFHTCITHYIFIEFSECNNYFFVFL